MKRQIPVLLSVFLILESSYYQGVYSGYNVAAVRFGNICYPTLGNLCISHGDPYFDLAAIHFYINWSLIFFIIGNMLDKRVLSQIISILSALASLLLFIYVYVLKGLYVTDEVPYIDLIRQTRSVDFIHILLVLALLLYQAFIAYQSFPQIKSQKTKLADIP